MLIVNDIHISVVGEEGGRFFGDTWSKNTGVEILSYGTGDVLCFICLMETIDLRSGMSKGNLYFFKIKKLCSIFY